MLRIKYLHPSQIDKALAVFPLKDRERILSAVDFLASRWPLVSGVKRLRGSRKCRLRVGDYRIIFAVEKGVLLIEEIANRRDVYR